MTGRATLLDPPPQTAAPVCAEVAADDPMRVMLERQLWILGQLAEGGLEIAQAIKAQAIERQATGSPEAGPVPAGRDLPLAYARVARAVRMSLLLQAKLIADLRTFGQIAQRAADQAALRADSARPFDTLRGKRRVQRIVGRIALAQHQDAEVAELMAREAAERLEQDELYGDVLARPVSEIVALICKDLGLDPDWPRLAEEAWARDEIASGAPGAPWRR